MNTSTIEIPLLKIFRNENFSPILHFIYRVSIVFFFLISYQQKGEQMKKRLIFTSAAVIAVILITTLILLPTKEKVFVEVRLAYLRADLHQLASWVAIEKGFFKEEGIIPVVTGVYNSGPEEMKGFTERKQDIGYVGIAPATTVVINQTAKVVILAQVNTEGSGLIVAEDGPIHELKDLQDKTIAVPGRSTVQDCLLYKLLEQNNISTDDVNIVIVKPAEMIDELGNGNIHGFIAWEPYPAQAIARGVGRMLTVSGEIWEDHPCCVLAIDANFLHVHPETAVSVVKAHIKATNFINGNREEAIRIGADYSGMEEETIRLAINNINYTSEQATKGAIEYLAFLSSMGYVRQVDAESFIQNFCNVETYREAIGLE
jgi:NitT/TauT family transport system substrate-binding protein